MFVIIFRPGPAPEGAFTADLNSHGHAPLLFLAIEDKTGRAFWAESFVNAHVYTTYREVELQMEDRMNLATIALEKMYLALHELTPVPKTEGMIAIMPLAFGTAVRGDYIEAA